MNEGVVFVKVGKLEPLVNGGDESHSHDLKRFKGSLRLIPSISQKEIVIAFYLLIIACITGGVFSLIDGEIFAAVILVAFAWVFYFFIKNGKGAGQVRIDTTARKLSKRRKGKYISVSFDAIDHLEIINKLKSGGNGTFVKTSELNVSLKNGKRSNLATGGNMDIIMAQATALAEAIGCDVHHDDND